MNMRIIGDVHGNAEDYIELIAEEKYSIQIGDMGFSQTYEKLMDYVPASHHRFVPGNHDDYDNLPPHALGDWGIYEIDGFSAFFVRGADSPDKDFRLIEKTKTKIKSWWDCEELTASQGEQALVDYVDAQPDFMITHDCPTFLTATMGSTWPPTHTQELLQRMYEEWQPKHWIFGHWHQDKVIADDGTTFICLSQLSHADFDCETQSFV